MHFDVVLSVYSSMLKKAEESSIQYSSRVDADVCVRALQMCVRACVRACMRALQMCARKLLTQRATVPPTIPSVPSGSPYIES